MGLENDKGHSTWWQLSLHRQASFYSARKQGETGCFSFTLNTPALAEI
jgi:hypothetical protein